MDKKTSRCRLQTPFVLRKAHSEPVSLASITMAGAEQHISDMQRKEAFNANCERNWREFGKQHASARDIVQHTTNEHPEFEPADALNAAANAAMQQFYPLSKPTNLHAFLDASAAVLRAVQQQIATHHCTLEEAIQLAFPGR